MNACATFLACRIRTTSSDGSVIIGKKENKKKQEEKKERNFFLPLAATDKFCSFFHCVIVDLNDVRCLYGKAPPKKKKISKVAQKGRNRDKDLESELAHFHNCYALR